jgi:glycosyltransferase involved in cell wall biosynthesis
MNVGLVVPGFCANERDWCIPALTSLVRRLETEHRVRVFALRYPHRRGRYTVSGTEIHALGGADARGLDRVSLLYRALGLLRREHRREPFDVLHGLWADEPGYVVARAARKLSIASVVTLLGGELVALHDIEYGGLRSRLNRVLTWRALRGATRVTSGSQHLASLARGRVGTEPLSLPIGVDCDRFSPGEAVASLLGGETKLLHVASLVPVKDQATLLRAFAQVARALPDAGLNLVGDGPMRSALERLTRELGIEDRVRFHGVIPHDALPPYYRACDLAVMSSRHEGQEWVTLEAAACGRTTVGTEVGVVADLVPVTTAVPVSDAGSLSRAILEALSDRKTLRARGALARRKVLARYSLEGTVASLSALYRGLGATRYSRSTSFTRSRSEATSTEKPA